MQILSLSPRVLAEGRRFFKSHPVITLKVIRAADFDSPTVFLHSFACTKCNWTWLVDKLYVEVMAKGLGAIGEELPLGHLPTDYLASIEYTHAWDQQSRSIYCGGRLIPQVESSTAKAV